MIERGIVDTSNKTKLRRIVYVMCDRDVDKFRRNIICVTFGVPMTSLSIFARDESVHLFVHFVAAQPKWVMFDVAAEIRHVPFS